MDREPGEEEQIPADGDGEADAYGHRARTLIFLVAAGFLVVGGLDLAVYWLKCRHDHLDISAGHCLYLSIPLVIGVVILLISSSLARTIDEYLDE
jgi:hypothetical protein